MKEDCIFKYGAVTLYGRTFQTVLLTLSYPSFNQSDLDRFFADARSPDYCGPATPSSPFESLGLGCSDFARHYFRNHGCFLFLWVLRWFTSPGSLHTPMYSAHGNPCSHRLGSPIRTSPDHRLLASPRGFSQLATSFIAYLRQGIHTHALSSLTIKLTPDTEFVLRHSCIASAPLRLSSFTVLHTMLNFCSLPVRYSVVKDHDSFQPAAVSSSDTIDCLKADQLIADCQLVGLGRLELPTSPLSGVRSSHLSYRPD